MSASVEAASPAVDKGNPWLGLASFTEETREYFYGRDEEVAELARRVQRKLLTVLFGQSGLGKTSILRAGLVPRLRAQGYSPVYVRVDYGRDAPEPAEQIKEAIRRARSEAAAVAPGTNAESLWEFLHHREAASAPTPLLIFDQFEEIFTLAQTDDFGRARAARFVEQLADLVENRPPKSLETQLDEDDSVADRFDFARSDYRVLIALREDYLAPLESLKTHMPSIAQNRLRLAPMTGTQALAAVTRPGGKLVSEEVAAAIVRFVAGGAELVNAEVEPSLLSLICRELNDTRVAQGRSEISQDLLAGSHATILSNFYERSLADQPAAVRRIIEDDLLTDSGFRENVAEESLVRRFATAGAAPNTLAVLVNRRLLRVEERLDVRRVELTHDVLCGVVKASRDQRHERESREATEKLLAEQRARELAARTALLRARKVAAVCTVLAVVAVAAAVLAYFNVQRARRAEHEAQETRATTEQGRMQSETLLGYLSDDFARELENTGRLSVVAEFSKRQIDYFHALPVSLKRPETVRNGALALIHHARALRGLGQYPESLADSAEAIASLESQRRAGDESQATRVTLALAYLIKAQVLDNQFDPAGPVAAQSAANLLQPLAEAPQPSAAARRAYVETLIQVGHEQYSANQNEMAARTERRAVELAGTAGARDVSSLEMAADFADAAGWLVEVLVSTGRTDEAREVGAQGMQVADKLLQLRPDHRQALHAEQLIESSLADGAEIELDPAAAMRYDERYRQISLELLNLDPNNIGSIVNLAISYQSMGGVMWDAGRLNESIEWGQKSLAEHARAAVGHSSYLIVRACQSLDVITHQSQIGDRTGAADTLSASEIYYSRIRKEYPPGSVAQRLGDACQKLSRAYIAYASDDLSAAHQTLAEVEQNMRAAQPEGPLQASQKAQVLHFAGFIRGPVEIKRGDFAAAAQAERAAIEANKTIERNNISELRNLAQCNLWLALALARQGQVEESARTIAPVVRSEREWTVRNKGDQWLPLELASALYVQSLTDAQRRHDLLREASTALNRLPPSILKARETGMWRNWIQQAQKSAG
jgi:hypothetical protein